MGEMESSPGEKARTAVNHAVGAPSLDDDKICMPLITVRVSDPNRLRSVVTTALVDPGAKTSLCTKRLVRELGIRAKPREILLTTAAERNVPCKVLMCGLLVGHVEDSKMVRAAVMTRVYAKDELPAPTTYAPSKSVSKRYSYLREAVESQVRYPPGQVELIIGQDTPEALAPREFRIGKKWWHPWALRTVLGWTINGPWTWSERAHKKAQAFTLQVLERELYEQLSRQVERFWQLDNLGLNEDSKGASVKDREVLRLWDETTVRKAGHYVAVIPFREKEPIFPDNRRMAEKRLESLGRRLRKDPQLREKYALEMEKLLAKDYAEIVPMSELARSDGRVWYLPHHAVINPNKDKPRIVFDCAASHLGTSLNNRVLSGPDYTNSLVGVLVRFREREVAFMTDVEAMFHQVRTTADDRDVLRFLWWPNGDLGTRPSVYRMKVHLFGGTWSPSVCIYALNRTARDFGESYDDETRSTVLRNFYVDDCLKSVDTSQQAVKIALELRELLKKGGFRLAKWASNSKELLECLPAEDRSAGSTAAVTDDSPLEERALGVYWDIKSDSLRFKSMILTQPSTKRGILSGLSSVYDPLGLASPFILRARWIVQELFRRKVDWDESVPRDLAQSWEEWKEDLVEMRRLRFPRFLGLPAGGGDAQIELHHFCDASEKAYGVVSYLRVENGGHVRVTLVMAKARLAPLKTQTIPRLELMGATLAARQDCSLKAELSVPVVSRFWTDSTLVLTYINATERRFRTFVSNRVQIIRQLSDPGDWRYVPTKDNPADDASRGARAKELDGTRWMKGPPFLGLSAAHWPVSPVVGAVGPDDPETKEEKATVFAADVEVTPVQLLTGYYSSWERLVRGVAWIRAVFEAWRLRQPVIQTLNVESLLAAEKVIWRDVQSRHFPKEIRAVAQDVAVPANSRLRRCRPVSRDGLLRSTGRLRRAHLPYEAKVPVILPGSEKAVELLVRDIHERTGHAGREGVLAETRQGYWILSGRVTVRRVLSGCWTCKRRNAKPESQLMAELPGERVEPGEPPFTYVGVDYFGPILVRRGRGTEKRYGCLFTCLRCRAVHLEVAYSLDVDSFLSCWQRFVARRGRPKLVRSDNGTNFTGAEKELARMVEGLKSMAVDSVMSRDRITWKFNPPFASHMGGVWERAIRTVRNKLSVLVREQVLTDEALHTVLAVAEGLVNNRPLTVVSDDPQDLVPLSPSDLLLTRKVDTWDHVEAGNSARGYSERRWRQVLHLVERFWQRWSREYLAQLHARSKWVCEKRNLKVGDVVLLHEGLLPRDQWMLGRVVDAHVGRDGLTRSARVRTSKGSELVRPISRMTLLEANVEEEARALDTDRATRSNNAVDITA